MNKVVIINPLTASAEHCVFNPVSEIENEPDFILNMLQTGANVDLDHDGFNLAKTIALGVTAHQTPNIRNLVVAWRGESTLVAFADAVAKNYLPDSKWTKPPNIN